MKYLPTVLLLFVILLAGNALLPALSTTPANASPPEFWDPRLDALGVSLAPATECSEGCWRLVRAQYEDEFESNGLHHIWMRALDSNGDQIADQRWHVGWPDGVAPLLSKAAPDWADFAIFGPGGCFDPNLGQHGALRAFTGESEARSDTVHGLGLPLCLHVSFRLTWQWVSEGDPATTPTSTVTLSPPATPSSTVPATSPASATPCVDCEHLWLPLTVQDTTLPPTLTPTPSATGTTIAPTPSATATTSLPPTTWDSRLDGLRVTLQRASDCRDGCWRLVSAQYQDETQSGGNHNIYGQVRSASGAVLADEPWHVAWPDGNVRLLTKAEPDMADFAIFACYDPEHGPGGYHAFAGDDPIRSDQVQGMGRPACHHVNFILVWQWVPGGLPPAPTATPSATTTPPVGDEGFSGQVVQTYTNCGLTQIFGVVHDADGNPLPGSRVRLTWDAAGAQTLYATAGDYIRPETDTSGWDFVLAPYASGNVWRLAVVDSGGNILGQDLLVRTDNHCESGAVNAAKVRFRKSP